MTLSDDDDDEPVSTAPVPPLSPETRRKQRALLAVVIILGIAIVVAFAVLVVGLIFGVPRSGAGEPKPWSYTLDVPAGTRVNSANAEAGRIVLHLTGPAGEDVVLVDSANGKVVGRIHLQPVR